MELKTTWSDLIIINGRLSHPQSQCLVERGNAVVQKMLGKWQETNESNDWFNGLGRKYFDIIIILFKKCVILIKEGSSNANYK